MAKLSKRAQLEQWGWKFTAIPRLVPEGLINDSSTGYRSPAFYDHKNPEAWQVTPPEGSSCKPRRFDGRSPNTAVRWAFEQAMAPQLKAELTGVAALVALMGDARSSGMVADGADDKSVIPSRADAELLSLCWEALGCDRIEHQTRDGDLPDPWTEGGQVAFKDVSGRLSEAIRAKARIMPRIVELTATTPAGAIAKAEAIATLFDNRRGLKAEAVASMVADLVAVFGPRPETGAAS